nr:retrovirus-related Pol polyprotein from transposon TNT 1-94 [Tanacetum cinerariifolium]
MLLGLSGFSRTSEMLGGLLSVTRLDLLLKDINRKRVYKTLFLKKNNRDIILVQVYVDDIIFGSTKKEWPQSPDPVAPVLEHDHMAADSDIPSGNTSQVPPASPCAPTAGTSEVPPAPFAIPTGASEMAELERERAEAQRKRQQDVLESAKFYNEDDWLNIRAQSSAIYNTCRTMVYVKSFSDAQLLQEFEKIHKVQSQSQIQAFNQTLKRPEPVLEEPFTKRPKSQEAYTPSMPEVSVSPVVTSPPSSRIRRKSLGRKPMHKSKSTPPTLDLDAPAQTFLKVVVDEDSDDEDYVDEVWSAVVGWELLSTPLGEINALYRIDGSTKHFSTLRQILHLVDLQDLMKLYGLVVQYYEHHPAVGAGLLF